jgi:hypothetical protein
VSGKDGVRKVARGLLVVATVLVAVNAWAGEPWQKSYKNWDAKDVQEILNDSPWSKPVEIERKETNKKDAVKFVVRWVSSRTLREASVRGGILQKRISEADAEKYLPPAPDDYQLAVVGTDMSSFHSADESILRDKTYLIAKKSKERITASQVEIVRGSDGKRINAIVFHFPKKSITGQAIVSSEEKELRFVVQTGAIEIKVRFDPQKMVDQQGMDL